MAIKPRGSSSLLSTASAMLCPVRFLPCDRRDTQQQRAARGRLFFFFAKPDQQQLTKFFFSLLFSPPHSPGSAVFPYYSRRRHHATHRCASRPPRTEKRGKKAAVAFSAAPYFSGGCFSLRIPLPPFQPFWPQPPALSFHRTRIPLLRSFTLSLPHTRHAQAHTHALSPSLRRFSALSRARLALPLVRSPPPPLLPLLPVLPPLR